MKKQDYFSVIDIGSTKICVVIASVDSENKIEILGVGKSVSSGIKMGVVGDIYKTKKSIKQAIEIAEKDSGLKVNSLYVAVSGNQIRSLNLEGAITISNYGESEIKRRHINAVIDNAKSKANKIVNDKNLKIIHSIPQFYNIDNEAIKIENPLGKYGCDLTGKVHIVFAKTSNLRDIRKCLELAGYEVREYIFAGLASGNAVLDEEQKKYGVILLDIGSGTTDICVYYDGSVLFSKTIAQGGMSITEVLAIGLNAKTKITEKLKIEKGNLQGNRSKKEVIKIVDINGEKEQSIELDKINGIIEFKVKEILENVYSSIYKEDYYDLIKAGIVITGGSSRLAGLQSYTKKMFSKFANLGKPDIESRLSGAKLGRLNDPTYSTVVGLLYYVANDVVYSGQKLGLQINFWSKIKNILSDFI